MTVSLYFGIGGILAAIVLLVLVFVYIFVDDLDEQLLNEVGLGTVFFGWYAWPLVLALLVGMSMALGLSTLRDKRISYSKTKKQIIKSKIDLSSIGGLSEVKDK